MRFLLTWAICLPAAMAACGSGDDGPPVNCNFSGSPSAQVGAGTPQNGFQNLGAGDEMFVVTGPQGLDMVTPSVRVHNVFAGQAGRVGHPNDPEVFFTLLMGSEVVGGSARENLGMSASADGHVSLGVFTPFTVPLLDYLNQTVTVRVNVSDACGRNASNELDVRVVR